MGSIDCSTLPVSASSAGSRFSFLSTHSFAGSRGTPVVQSGRTSAGSATGRRGEGAVNFMSGSGLRPPLEGAREELGVTLQLIELLDDARRVAGHDRVW